MLFLLHYSYYNNNHSTTPPPSDIFLISFSHLHLHLRIVRDLHNFLTPVILVQFIVSYTAHHCSQLATYCLETAFYNSAFLKYVNGIQHITTLQKFWKKCTKKQS